MPFVKCWRVQTATVTVCLLFVSLQEKYKRALADTENLRTRSQKMTEDAKLYGNR